MSEVMTTTVFDQAAKVFDGWTDPDTGARVLRLFATNMPRVPGIFGTYYHQYQCFLDGGRKIVLHARRPSPESDIPAQVALDLTTGEAARIVPSNYSVVEVMDNTKLAAVWAEGKKSGRAVLWDMQTEQELASKSVDDSFTMNSINFLSDGQRALVFMYRGQYYTENVVSRHYLLTPGEQPRLIMEADGYFCSHMVGCPTDPNMYSYDRWPSPKRDIDQAITVRTLDGSFEQTAKLDEHAPRPADMWGCRDHYVWTPDGSRIVSYLNSKPIELLASAPDFNHFTFDWVLSALDWRTGEDFAARYPEGRWGGHMGVSPDSKYILCCGGPGFDKLFAVSIEELRQGWNEHIICSYPKITSAGKNSDPFPYPWALPDGSGVFFNAGWPGDEFGVYLAEWPTKLK